MRRACIARTAARFGSRSGTRRRWPRSVPCTRLLVERAFAGIEAKETAVETAFDVAPPNPLVSGSRASLVPFDTLSRQGGRFVWTVTTQQQIEEIVGEPAVAMPIRVYVGLASAPDEEARVELLFDELDRTGAFDRTWLFVASPTGTGYVNYAAVGGVRAARARRLRHVRHAIRGAPVVPVARSGQGGAPPEPPADSRRSVGRLAELPPDRRPTVVLFGESLGAWTSQDPFVGRGTAGTARRRHRPRRVDRHPALQQVEGRGAVRRVRRHRLVDASACSTTSTSGGRWILRRRERIRYVMITHHDDGVALFGPELAIQAPEWLRRSGHSPGRGPEGDAVGADVDVLPGARRHEELGHRRAGPVRRQGPRLPRRPAPVPPRDPRLRASPSSSIRRIDEWLETA